MISYTLVEYLIFIF